MTAVGKLIRFLNGRSGNNAERTRSAGFEDPTEVLPAREKWSPFVLYKLFLYFAILFIVMNHIPNSIWDPNTMSATVVIGSLGIWRYGWWFTHAIRAQIYRRLVYPKMRGKALQIWNQGWRPHHMHFMMTTFREHRVVTELVIESICRQLREIGASGTLWLGSGDIYDEKNYSAVFGITRQRSRLKLYNHPPKPTGEKISNWISAAGNEPHRHKR